MRSLRRTPALAVLLLAPVLAGCSDDDGGPSTEREAAEESSSPSDPDTPVPSDGTSGPTSAGGGALPAACDVLTADDVASAYGVQVGPGSIGGGGHSEDVEWQSDNCSWEADDLLEVGFALSGPDDYPAGFTCPEPGAVVSQVEPVEVEGATRAFWKVDDSPPLEAALRVCTDRFNFDIDLELEDGVEHEGDPRQQSVALAETALAALGG